MAQSTTNTDRFDPYETYTVACHLMAMGATGDPSYHARMTVLADRLGNFNGRTSHRGVGNKDFIHFKSPRIQESNIVVRCQPSG